MKTKSIRNIFVLVLILFSVLGCGRYEEGPCMSFRSPESRLCGSKWRVVSFMKNDSDLTEQWTTNYDWRLYFHNHYDSELGETTGMYVYNADHYGSAFGSWRFISSDPDGINADVTKISMGLFLPNNVSAGIYPLQTEFANRYNILRLTNDELWLQHTDSIQNVYVIKFENNLP